MSALPSMTLTEGQLADMALVYYGLRTPQEAGLPDSGVLCDEEGAPVAQLRDARLELREPLRWTHPQSVRAELQDAGWLDVHAVLGTRPPRDLPSVRPLLVLVSSVGRPDSGDLVRRHHAWRDVTSGHPDVRVVPVPVRAEELASLAGRLAEAYGAATHSVLEPAPDSAGTGGRTVFFTGLSGAGKSTIARRLVDHLAAHGDRAVTLLDGDVVRTHLSKGLGFSREDRDINVVRIGWVAAEITKHGGLVVCAPIAPYAATRALVRRMVEEQGGPGSFMLVHVATPLEQCERRDRKGLYRRARRGELTSFTGVSDPYEEPVDAEVVVTTDGTVEDSVRTVLRALGLSSD